MTPSHQIITRATALRHALHRAPELSNAEEATAALIAERMQGYGARVTTGLGGTGVAACFGPQDGPAMMIRCELDALPILETGQPEWVSQRPGTAHLCGHDGHMAILDALAQQLAGAPPAARIVLLFQPAEETGAGAAQVLADPRFAALDIAMGISLHNMPGLPLGAVALRAGPMNCASRGLKITLTGRTSHASEPEKAVSPAPALAALIPALAALSRDLPTEDAGFRLCTVTHARLGEATFGVSPGAAELRVTLRTLLDDQMAALEAEARALIARHAEGLSVEITVHEAFGHCVNDPRAVAVLEQALGDLPRTDQGLPMRASEDFGRFGAAFPTAMFLLGSGETCPPLHAPDYDFPDTLIATGAQVFLRAIGAWTP